MQKESHATDRTSHYRLTQAQQRKRTGRSGSFDDRALCGNGSAHATLRADRGAVDCPACLAVLATEPDYLNPAVR